MPDAPPQRGRRRLTVVDVIGILSLAAIVLAGAVLVAMHAGDSATADSGSSSTSTAASPADTERAVIEACRRAIIDRADDDSILESGRLTWESTSATHTALGSYDVSGVVAAQIHTATWRFSYTCKMAAAQFGDGSGAWFAIDNGFAQL